MSLVSGFLFMGLVLAMIVLLCLGVTRMEQTAKSSEFDERQQLVRGRGYRLANWVATIYFIVAMCVMIGQVDGEKTVEPWLLVFIGFQIQNLVFHAYCLLNQAALPLSGKPVSTILSYCMSGVISLLGIRSSLAREPLSLVGHGSAGWVFVMTSGFFFSLAIMHLIQLLRRERE